MHETPAFIHIRILPSSRDNNIALQLSGVDEKKRPALGRALCTTGAYNIKPQRVYFTGDGVAFQRLNARELIALFKAHYSTMLD